MSEMEMKTDVEVEDFTDELSDEALDRASEGALSSGGGTIKGVFPPVADR